MARAVGRRSLRKPGRRCWSARMTSTDVSVTGAFTGGQSSGRILVVPVLESELGASWQPTDSWRFSAGWFVQAWFDLGVSGGTFSGANLPFVGFPPIQNVFGGLLVSTIITLVFVPALLSLMMEFRSRLFDRLWTSPAVAAR